MKKALLKGLAVALFFATVASSSAWAESNFTITKADGTPAVEGTDYTTESYITLKTNDLILSGEFDLAIYLGYYGGGVDNYTFTLKDATITSDLWAGTLCYMETQSLNLVLEGTNRIVNTGSEGSAIRLYNNATSITFTGSGELYMTSQADQKGIAHSCLRIGPSNEDTRSATAEGFTIKGSTTPNAEISTLADALIGTYKYSLYGEQEALGILIGEERCNTVWMKKGSAFDPETDYVVVTYKEGSETKTATYKAADVEKVEWKKGTDISE